MASHKNQFIEKFKKLTTNFSNKYRPNDLNTPSHLSSVKITENTLINYKESEIPNNIKPNQNIFDWMNDGEILNNSTVYDANDIFFKQFEDQSHENFLMISKKPYYNPNAVYLINESGEDYTSKEKHAMRCIVSHKKFLVSLKRHQILDAVLLKMLDIHRNWLFRPWIDKHGFFPNKFNSNLHLVRSSIDSNIKVVMPEYRLKFFKEISFSEFNIICKEDKNLYIEIDNIRDSQRNTKQHREFTDEEIGDYTCGICHCICYLPVVCQSIEREKGMHSFCYLCIKTIIMEKEMSLCCEMQVVECPTHCGRFFSITNNQRPLLEDRYKMYNFFNKCLDCKGRFKSSKFKDHLLNCFESTINKQKLKKFNELKLEIENIKTELANVYEALDNSKIISISQLEMKVKSQEEVMLKAYEDIKKNLNIMISNLNINNQDIDYAIDEKE